MGRISRKFHSLLTGRPPSHYSLSQSQSQSQSESQSQPPSSPPSPSRSPRRRHPRLCNPIPDSILRRTSSFARLPKRPPPPQQQQQQQQLRKSSSIGGSSTSSAAKPGYRLFMLGLGPGPGAPPKGHLPIRLHNSSQLFFVKAQHLNHPILADLLRRSAEEYGYPPTGALRVSCDADTFRDIIRGLDRPHAAPPPLIL